MLNSRFCKIITKSYKEVNNSITKYKLENYKVTFFVTTKEGNTNIESKDTLLVINKESNKHTTNNTQTRQHPLL